MVKKKRSLGSIHGVPVSDRGRIVIRGVRRDPPDFKRLIAAFQALIDSDKEAELAKIELKS